MAGFNLAGDWVDDDSSGGGYPSRGVVPPSAPGTPPQATNGGTTAFYAGLPKIAAAGSGAYDNLYNSFLHGLNAIRRYAPPNMAPYAAAIGSGGFDVGQSLGPANAAAATPMNANPLLHDRPAPPRAQAPPSAPGTSLSGVNGQGAGGFGAPNAAMMNNAALGDQIMGGNTFAQQPQQQPPAVGALAAQNAGPQQQSSPFTMVLRPNAPAEGGGRGGGGTPLATALDLSGYQPPPPPAPANYNLGYRAQADPRPAPRAPVHVAPVAHPNPFAGWQPSDPRPKNPWNAVPGNPFPYTGGNY
jgi:hypothetical protein